MSVCSICLTYREKSIVHTDGCPYAASAPPCRQCHHRGHTSPACTEAWAHWERPTTLEELIPADVRIRYGIISHTPTSFVEPRGEATHKELSDRNTIVVPDDYNELLKFVDTYKIKVEKITKPSADICFKAIKAWGVTRGCRVITKTEIIGIQ